MKGPTASILGVLLASGLLLCACTGAPPPASPTTAPSQPKTVEPTKAPAAAVQPTVAPQTAPTLTAVPTKKVDYPGSKPVTVMIPLGPGALDTSTRFVAAHLEKELKSPFPVVTKTGANGQVATSELANSKPDGYTLLGISLTSTLSTYLDPERKAGYDRSSFQPIAAYVSDPGTICVAMDSPYKSVKDLIDAAKAKPDQVKIATAGLMNVIHLGTVMLGKIAGVDFPFVHFEGAGPANTAVVGGHADAVVTSFGGVYPFVRNNQLRVLGVMGAKQHSLAPGVKTLKEQGYELEVGATFGLIAPAGTPKEIVDILQDSVKRYLDSPDAKKKFEEAGLFIDYKDQKQFGDYWTQLDPWMKEALEAAK